MSSLSLVTNIGTKAFTAFRNGASKSVAKTIARQEAKATKALAKNEKAVRVADSRAAVKIEKQKTKQTALQSKSAALNSTSTGSAALSTKKTTAGKILNGIAGAGNLAITGLLGASLIGELMNPQELPTNQDDPTQDFIDQQGGGFLDNAENTAEEILDPLSDVPVIGDAVDAAAENGMSLPLLILFIVLIGAAIFAAVKLIKKGKKAAAKRTRKPAKRGTAA